MAIFLTGKLIDRQDFNRNLLNRSIFPLDYSLILYISYISDFSVSELDFSV